MDLGQTVSYWAKERAQECALVYEDQNITYEELDKSINRVANGLHNLSIEEGDRVALMLPNIPEFVYSFYACQKLGAIAVPFNTMYKGKEIAHILKDSGAKAIICLTNFVPLVNEILSELPALKHIITTGERTVTLADPESTLFVQAVFSKSSVQDLDDAYKKFGNIMKNSLSSLGATETWYKHRGSLRCGGKKIAGFFISEVEDIYIVNVLCFTSTFKPDDFFCAIWVPPEVKDKMLEPLTSLEEERGEPIDDEAIRETICASVEKEFSVKIARGSMTREEVFGYEKQRHLMGKPRKKESSEKVPFMKKVSLFFSGRK